MKNMFESGEIFEAYARIDLRIYGIESAIKEMDSVAPKSNINRMIDNATGYNKYAELRANLKEMVTEILEDFKFIEAEKTEAYKKFHEMSLILSPIQAKY